MQIISNFNKLLEIEHIAWGDGPGWLLGMVVCYIVSGIIFAVWARA